MSRQLIPFALALLSAIASAQESPVCVFQDVNVITPDAEDEFGSIAVGLAADLVLLADNPLVDAGAASLPLGVMVRGRWLDRDALDAGLAAIAARHR